MSKKTCAVLLRLYPSAFRQHHGEEALRLMVDRARDERGFLRKSRLCIDLLWDLAATAARHAWRSPVSQLSSEPNGPLFFHVVGQESPSTPSLFIGLLVSLTLLATLPFAFRADPGSSGNWNFPRGPVIAQDAPPPAEPPRPPQAPASRKLDAEKRHQLIQAIARNLKDHYFDPAISKEIAEALRANEASGVYNSITAPAAFATLLARQLRDLSHDMHIDVVYSEEELPSGPPPPQSAEALNQYRARMLQLNCTFEKAEMLPDQIGYLKFNFFPRTMACQDTAQAAMAKLNDAHSVILDLRDNAGGFPDMVILMASYFFDHPEYMYSPRDNITEQSFTRPIPGTKLADKPLFLLTSSRTISAAEQFSYDLKALKRATLVGETTAGSAHSGLFLRIDDHLGMGVPEIRPINPFSKTDWEGVGVEPDVKVKAADALTTALALARKKSKN
jgi:hypothetical protein